MLTSQENIDLTLTTPLGKDALILDRFEGIEQISEPFCFSLDMHSASPTLDLSALVGKEVKITYTVGKKKRHFCGIVGTAEQGWTVRKEHQNVTYYQAKAYPKFWLLKFTRDYRIFQNKSAMDIIKEVLKDNGITEIEDKTKACGKGMREYCVQYGESSFDFVSRLMEEEGIFYFFKHTAATHKMILIDDSKDAENIAPAGTKYMKAYSGTRHFDVVHTLHIQEQVVAKKYAAADFNFETPTTPLYNKITGEGMGGEIYDYPGLFMKTKEGDTIANHRLQDLEWNKKTLRGFSTVPLFAEMSKFSLKEHPRPDANKDYILYRVHHRINQNATEGEDIYQNEFVAFPGTVPFRTPRKTPKPRIHSTQTAIVTTKSGEEIWCDEYGRIKVKFHWDQRGTNDEKSSCWIRVAQLWAGSSWGGLWTPRVHMEVVVTFLDGDPDRPLITGCVYNGQNPAPYAKEEPTKSTIKSNTTKGGSGFNEFRFEDKKGSEEIYTHAQKDQNTVIEDSRTLLIKTGDDTSTITQGDRTVTLKAEKGDRPQRGNDTLTLEKGNRLVALKGAGEKPCTHTLDITKGDNIIHLKEGNEKKTLDKGNQEITLTEGNQTITLSKGDQTLKITGKRDITVEKDETHTSKANYTLKVAGDLSITVDGKLTIKSTGALAVETSADAKVKATGSLTLESGGEMTLKSGAGLTLKASASWKGEGLDVNLKGQVGATVDGGPMATVKATGKATLQGAGMASVSGGMISLG